MRVRGGGRYSRVLWVCFCVLVILIRVFFVDVFLTVVKRRRFVGYLGKK